MEKLNKILSTRRRLVFSLLTVIFFLALFSSFIIHPSIEENVHNTAKTPTKIAFVKPVFTAAAYNNSFYVFFRSHINEYSNTNVTKDIHLLSSKLTPAIYSRHYAMLTLVDDVKAAVPKADVNVISDVDVDKGLIFDNNTAGFKKNAYRTLILGHQEYVTQKEYDNLRQFVANGGTVIFLDSGIFLAEVTYDDNTDTIRLVKGHSWAFNGKSAWKSVFQRWNEETNQWVGSSYFHFTHNIKFGNNPFGYTSHEEQYLTNTKDKVILNYNATFPDGKPLTPKATIATYELQYGKGKVITTGLFSDDIIGKDAFREFFRGLLMRQM